MSDGKGLKNAKSAKKDEFYTQWSDIEKEMNAYLEYDSNVFRNKTLCTEGGTSRWDIS